MRNCSFYYSHLVHAGTLYQAQNTKQDKISFLPARSSEGDALVLCTTSKVSVRLEPLHKEIKIKAKTKPAVFQCFHLPSVLLVLPFPIQF